LKFNSTRLYVFSVLEKECRLECANRRVVYIEMHRYCAKLIKVQALYSAYITVREKNGRPRRREIACARTTHAGAAKAATAAAVRSQARGLLTSL